MPLSGRERARLCRFQAGPPTRRWRNARCTVGNARRDSETPAGLRSYAAAVSGSLNASWVDTSPLSESGCVTVATNADTVAVRLAFGAGDDVVSEVSPSDESFWDNEPASYWAWFSTEPAGAGHVTVIEVNGFQGSRPEVLRSASRASAAGLAASAFWNVNGMVIFTCARRGKVIASIDLSILDVDDEDSLTGLPRPLKALARTAVEDGADLPEVAIAMVQKFTGVNVGPEALEVGSAHLIWHVVEDFEGYGADYLPSHLSDFPQLTSALVALDPVRQRRIAKEATLIAVSEAGLSGHPAVASVLDQFADVDLPVINPGVGTLKREINRRADQLTNEEMELSSYGAIEIDHAFQQAWGLKATRHVTNPDSLAAALACCGAAIVAAKCAKLERGMQLVRDGSGGRLVDTHDPTEERTAAVVQVLTEMADANPEVWPQLRTRLPPPLTEEERARAVEIDRRRQAAGEFSEYRISND